MWEQVSMWLTRPTGRNKGYRNKNQLSFDSVHLRAHINAECKLAGAEVDMSYGHNVFMVDAKCHDHLLL